MTEFVLPEIAQLNLAASGLVDLDAYAAHWADDVDYILKGWGHGSLADVREAAAHHLSNRCCNAPDIAGAGGILESRWPKKCSDELLIFVAWSRWDSDDMSMGIKYAREQFQRAMDDWMRVVDLTWSMTSNEREAHCKVGFAQQKGSTLAWSHLANGSCSLNARQEYDLRRWTPHYFYLVVLHELGHLLGLPHLPGRHVLNPSIISSLEGLTDRDIAEGQRLYGKAKRKPDPVDPRKPTPHQVEIPGTVVWVDNVAVGRLTFVPNNNDPGDGGGWGDV